MIKFDKKLKVTLEAMTPEGMAKTAKACRDSADTLSEGSEMLIEASKAFDAGNFADGYGFLRDADKRLSKKT